MAQGLWIPRPFVKPPSGAMLNPRHPLVSGRGLLAMWPLNEGAGKAIDVVGQRSATPDAQSMWSSGVVRASATQKLALDSYASDQTFWIADGPMTIAYHGMLDEAAVTSVPRTLCIKNNNWILWSAPTDYLPGGWPNGTLTLVWFDTGFVQRIKSVPVEIGVRHSAGFSQTNNGTIYQGYYNGKAVATNKDGWFSAGRDFLGAVFLMDSWPGTLDCVAFAQSYWTAEDWRLWHDDPYSMLLTR